MQKQKSNYERIILALAALAALGVGGWLIYLTTGFAATLEPKRPTTRSEMPQPPYKNVEDAIKRAIEVPKPWAAPVINNKPVPLNKSVLVVQRGGESVDLYLETTQLRPPMTNAYLRENSLLWEHPNVGDLDPDGDGFNNLEEFNAGTKPKDAKSHPPITDKLFLVERTAKDYRVVLKNASGQVSLPDEQKKKTYFIDLTKVGTEPAQTFGGANGDRFKCVKFEKKSMPDPTVGERDVSELTCEEVVTKRPLVLIVGKEENLAEYKATFEFRLHRVVRIPTVDKGGSFRIPEHNDITYRVLDIQESGAEIAPLKADGQLGEKIPIRKL